MHLKRILLVILSALLTCKTYGSEMKPTDQQIRAVSFAYETLIEILESCEKRSLKEAAAMVLKRSEVIADPCAKWIFEKQCSMNLTMLFAFSSRQEEAKDFFIAYGIYRERFAPLIEIARRLAPLRLNDCDLKELAELYRLLKEIFMLTSRRFFSTRGNTDIWLPASKDEIDNVNNLMSRKYSRVPEKLKSLYAGLALLNAKQLIGDFASPFELRYPHEFEEIENFFIGELSKQKDPLSDIWLWDMRIRAEGGMALLLNYNISQKIKNGFSSTDLFEYLDLRY